MATVPGPAKAGYEVRTGPKRGDCPAVTFWYGGKSNAFSANCDAKRDTAHNQKFLIYTCKLEVVAENPGGVS